MPRSTLLIGVGGALTGVAVVMAILAVVYEPFLLLVALPFAGAGYLIWYQGTGRLEDRVREAARRGEFGRTSGGDGGPFDGTPFGGRDGSGARSPFGDATGRTRERRDGRERTAGRRAGADGGWRARVGASRRAGRERTARGQGRQAGYGPGGYAPGSGAPSGPSTDEAYRRLDLDPGSDPDEIRTAYREKVKEVHPDTDEGSEEAFKRVNEAYEVLEERVE